MNDSIHVFAGPSLPPRARPRVPGIVFHEPARQGDVYRLVAQRPRAVAIIDGYFERVPAVWHKEVLWALSEGVHVFGASSMGALRAAELSDFGMVGVGQVFRSFHEGRLTDDDEVTIVHAEKAFDYRPGSEAMVNIRATLAAAEEQGILSPAEAERLVASAKRLFYPDRSYPALLQSAKKELPPAICERFTRWVCDPAQRIDQKRLDALELVEQLRNFGQGHAEPMRVAWTFQHTDAWEQVRLRFLAETHVQGEPAEAHAADERADRARLRALEIAAARRDGYRPTRTDLEREVAEFRKAHRLTEPGALRGHLSARGVSDADFERLMAGQACVRRSRLIPQYDLDAEMSDLSLIDEGPSDDTARNVRGSPCRASEVR